MADIPAAPALPAPAAGTTAGASGLAIQPAGTGASAAAAAGLLLSAEAHPVGTGASAAVAAARPITAAARVAQAEDREEPGAVAVAPVSVAPSSPTAASSASSTVPSRTTRLVAGVAAT